MRRRFADEMCKIILTMTVTREIISLGAFRVFKFLYIFIFVLIFHIMLFHSFPTDISAPFPHREVKIRKDENPADLYQILPELGRGSFGTVFLCKDKSNGLDLAVKIVSYKKKKEKSAMEMEIEVLASLSHSAIIQVYDAFDYGNKLYCFMEV